MRFIFAILLTVMPAVALAHPGHVAEIAGHDHWVAGIALGAAIAIAAWGAIKGLRKDDDAEDEAIEDDLEPEQAEA